LRESLIWFQIRLPPHFASSPKRANFLKTSMLKQASL
jgi:hypothetical protein